MSTTHTGTAHKQCKHALSRTSVDAVRDEYGKVMPVETRPTVAMEGLG